MAYVLNGLNQEANGFTTAIANFALEAMHESNGLVDFTRVVSPNQGDTYLVPNFGAITYQDYTPGAYQGGVGTALGNGFQAGPPTANAGAAFEQTPAIAQRSIQATPAVAATAFDVFYAWTTSFELAATIGEELGGSYGEKVDQRVCAAFVQTGGAALGTTGFKNSPGNTVVVGADGFNQMVELGAQELQVDGGAVAGGTAGFISNTVLGLVRNVRQNYTVAKLPGRPIVVLDSNGISTGVGATVNSGSSMIRALGELSGGAVTTAANSGGSAITSLGEELLATGRLTNLYGCAIIFSNFLANVVADAGGATPTNGNVNGAAVAVMVGAYFHETALFTVLKEGLQVKMGEKPGGLQMWLTGLAYMGAGVADRRRGGAINISQG